MRCRGRSDQRLSLVTAAGGVPLHALNDLVFGADGRLY
jgi:hypothetical protein